MREPEEIITAAIAEHNPVAIFVGFSGGDDSTVAAHWMMNNVPGCRVFHCNTGIGLPAARTHTYAVCERFGWPLTEIMAKEDCGSDYEALVKRFGFPGPAWHSIMYRWLKERCVEKLVRDNKKYRSRQRVLIATGIYQGESNRRSGYGNDVIKRKSAQVWVNPLYFWTQEQFAAYREKHNLPRNPVKEILGISGECLCGAFAHKGEKAALRIVCPSTADRLDRLEAEVKALGFPWGWEDRPPRGWKLPTSGGEVGPMCMGCEKIGSASDLEDDVVLPSIFA